VHRGRGNFSAYLLFIRISRTNGSRLMGTRRRGDWAHSGRSQCADDQGSLLLFRVDNPSPPQRGLYWIEQKKREEEANSRYSHRVSSNAGSSREVAASVELFLGLLASLAVSLRDLDVATMCCAQLLPSVEWEASAASLPLPEPSFSNIAPFSLRREESRESRHGRLRHRPFLRGKLSRAK